MSCQIALLDRVQKSLHGFKKVFHFVYIAAFRNPTGKFRQFGILLLAIFIPFRMQAFEPIFVKERAYSENSITDFIFSSVIETQRRESFAFNFSNFELDKNLKLIMGGFLPLSLESPDAKQGGNNTPQHHIDAVPSSLAHIIQILDIPFFIASFFIGQWIAGYLQSNDIPLKIREIPRLLYRKLKDYHRKRKDKSSNQEAAEDFNPDHKI
jgi:hypothetical protein